MISLLLPTRGRPALARRFLDSVAEHTGDLADVEVVLYVDEDDVDSHTLGHDRVRVTRIIGPLASMGSYNTACLERSAGSIVMLVNDDVIIRTSGWDDHVRALDREYADRIYLGYPNDLFKRRQVSAFPILSRTTCDLLESPFPSEYRGGLIDYHLRDIFERLRKLDGRRIRYLPHVVFEHCHYRTGKNVFDETYRRRNRFGDDATFLALRSRRRALAARLAAAIAGRSPPELSGGLADPDPTLVPGLPRAFWFYGRAFLGDTGLPFLWRLWLFVWYCGRHVAGRTSSPSTDAA
jgi:hypothetical protein